MCSRRALYELYLKLLTDAVRLLVYVAFFSIILRLYSRAHAR